MPRRKINNAQVEEAERPRAGTVSSTAQSPLEAEGPYQVQYDLQDMMQSLVGIVRREEEMARALDGIQKLRQRAADSRRPWPSRIQSRLAHSRWT